MRLTCAGNIGEVLQSMEYLPSGVTYNQRNYSMQPYRFCGKEEVTLHGFDMYDSQARWQYSLIPRFSSMDPLAEDYYHLSPYAYCAGDPVNLVDPDGRKIMISDGTNMYIWMEHNGVWGFYDNDGNLYSGDTEYMNEYSNALIELSSTNTGYYIVSTLANDESFDVTLFSIPSLGNKYSSDAPSINWNYKTEYLKYIPTTNGPQKNIITSLGHELAHAVFQRDGGDSKETWEAFPGENISISEIYTTHIENKIRSERGLPLRTHYLSDENGHGVGERLIKDGKSLFYNINEETKFIKIVRKGNRYTY